MGLVTLVRDKANRYKLFYSSLLNTKAPDENPIVCCSFSGAIFFNNGNVRWFQEVLRLKLLAVEPKKTVYL